MNEKLTLNDYSIGEKFITPGRTITESDITSFAGLSGDYHPLHTDITYAEKQSLASVLCTACWY